MPENPYTSGSGMKLNTGKMTMQYEMHRAWDEGFAAGRAAAHPAGHIYDGSCPDDTQPDARDPKCPACAAATPDPPDEETPDA
jgi:hypothetical protein